MAHRARCPSRALQRQVEVVHAPRHIPLHPQKGGKEMTSEERDFPCECHDTDREHDAEQEAQATYYARYFGQDHGTKEERRRRLEAMDPRKETLCQRR